MILTLFLFYIYGDHTLNQNKKFLEKIDKDNVKVISPNFELEYGLSLNDVEKA